MLYRETDELPDLRTFDFNEERRELVIRFVFDIPKDKKFDYAADNERRITDWIKNDCTPLVHHLLGNVSRDSKKYLSLLGKHLRSYVAKNTFDYFIHKDLGGFLSRELDFYIKNEVMHLDDVDTTDEKKAETWLAQVRAIRRVGKVIIDFLAQIENFQKKLWLKKKFVVATHYCLSLDRVPVEFYPEIAANDAQRQEWVRLFAIDEIQGDIMTAGYSTPLSVDFLKENQNLILDTKFFTDTFKEKLVESIDNLDDQCDGLLIHSENFQALQLLQTTYRERVKCIYIDPPYNTGSDGFLYKDNCQHSSWMSMMENRLFPTKKIMHNESAIFASIDDREQALLKILLETVFLNGNFVADIRWKGRGGRQDSKYFANIHEDILCFAKQLEAFHAGEELKDEGVFPKFDQKKKCYYKTQLLRKWGSNSLRENRPNLYYAIQAPDGSEVYPVIYEEVKQVAGEQPATCNFVEIAGCWRWGQQTMAKAIENENIEFLKNKFGKWVAYEKLYAPSPDEMATKKFTTWIDYISNGTEDIKDLFKIAVFDYPKSPELIIHFLKMAGVDLDEYVLDYFAGSGTTAHAVMNLNREDGGKRKYILVEMGAHFDTVLKPRLEKVAYAKEWKDGKPTSRNTGLSHCFKYLSLESYEDALSNIELPSNERNNQLQMMLGDEYLLNYMLNLDATGSILNLEAFRDPFAYRLKVTERNETKETHADLVETFNYLIGLTVTHLHARRSFNVTAISDGEYEGAVGLVAAADGVYTFRQLEGRLRDGTRVLVIWRTVRDNLLESNAALDAYFTRYRINPAEREFDVIYVNGDNTIENLRRDDETWKVRLIEPEFKKRMFEEE